MKKSKIIIALMIIVAVLFAGFSVYAADDDNQFKKENEAKVLYELEEQRTLSSKAYAMSDGTVRHQIYASDIHYKDSSGNLKEIDIKVKDIDSAKNNGYKYKNGENSWDVYFADKGKAQDLVEIKQDSYSISFSLDSAKDTAVAGKSTAMQKGKSELYDYYIEDPTVVMYRDIKENVDFAYTIREGYLKEDIILNEVPESNDFSFIINVKNLELVLENDILYYNDAKTGKEVFTTSNLFMEDSKLNSSNEVSMKLSKISDGKYTLTIIADEKFLNDANTVYPVVIDPTIQNNYTMDVFVSSYMPTTNMNSGDTRAPYLRTGKDNDYGIRRTYIQFRNSDIDAAVGTNDVIESAYVALKRYSSSGTIDLNAYQVLSSWSSNSLDWSPQPTVQSYGYTYNPVYDDWYRIYITFLVKGWESGSITNYGVMIRDTNESSTSVWATFRSSDNWSTDRRPMLVINTNYVPPTPTPTPVVTATPTPTAVPDVDITSVSPIMGYMLQGQTYSLSAYVDGGDNPTVELWNLPPGESESELLGQYINAGSYYNLNLTPSVASPFVYDYSTGTYKSTLYVFAEDSSTSDTYEISNLAICSKIESFYDGTDTTFYYNSITDNSFRDGATSNYNCAAYAVGVNDENLWDFENYNPNELELLNFMAKTGQYVGRSGNAYTTTVNANGYPKVIYYTDEPWGTGSDGHFAKVMSWDANGFANQLYSKWGGYELVYSTGYQPFQGIYGSTAVKFFRD